jgi:hypothetical protein
VQAKSQASLKVAGSLHEHARRSPKSGFLCSATNRYYYALYQATRGWVERQNRSFKEFRESAKDWEHGMMVNVAWEVRKSTDDMDLYKTVRDLRERADYSEIPISLADLDDQLIKDLVAFVALVNT